MGSHFSLPDEDLAELLAQTHFKKDDVKRWYRKFMKDYPDGQLNKEQFTELYTKIYSANFANRFADHIFRSFDHNKDGHVSFKELMLTLSLTTTGTTREKLEWSFNVYDLDGNGRITLDEVFHVINCMCSSSRRRRLNNFSSSHHHNSSSCHPCDYAMSSEEVERMFKVVDKNSDGYWSLDEFIDGVQAHPAFAKMLNQTPEADKTLQRRQAVRQIRSPVLAAEKT